MNKLLNNMLMKATAWALLGSFICVFVCQDYAFARKYIEQELNKDLQQHIEVPFEYGQVTERHRSGSLPGVILIQDLHANYEVQKNILAILNYIDKNHGIDRIGVEGNSEKVDVSLIASIPDNNIKAGVIDYFMQKGYVTGAENFTSYRKIPVLDGLEEEELYQKDKTLLLSSLNHRPDIIQYLERIKYLLKTMEDRICGADLTKFRKQYILYRQNKLSPHTFQGYLRGWARKAGISIGSISEEFNKYLMVVEREGNLDYRNIEKEYKKLLKELGLDGEGSRISLTFNRLKSILGAPESVRDRMISKIHADPQYSSLKAYIECMQLNRTLNTYKVIAEENKVISRVSYGLCSCELEKDYLFASNYTMLLIKFLLNQMTRSELDEFYMSAERFEESVRSLEREASRECSEIDTLIGTLAPYVQEMKDFYDTACQRDISFVEKFSKYLNENRGNLVMITGGFHTDGVSRKLKEAGIGYTVIIPRVSAYTEEDMRLYYSLLREEEKLSYEDMILQNLALPSFLRKIWLPRRIIARGVSSYIRRDMKEIGREELADKVKDFTVNWIAKHDKVSEALRDEIKDRKSISLNIDTVITAENELMFTLNLSGETVTIKLNDKDKLEIISKEEVQTAVDYTVKERARRRYDRLLMYAEKEQHKQFAKNTEVTAVICGLKPMTRIEKAGLNKDELSKWLKMINKDLDVIDTDKEYFIYDLNKVIETMNKANVHALMKEEEKFSFDEFKSNPMEYIEKQEDWKLLVLNGFSIDDAITAKRKQDGIGDVEITITKDQGAKIIDEKEIKISDAVEDRDWLRENPGVVEILASIRNRTEPEAEGEKPMNPLIKGILKFIGTNKNIIGWGLIGIGAVVIVAGIVVGLTLTTAAWAIAALGVPAVFVGYVLLREVVYEPELEKKEVDGEEIKLEEGAPVIKNILVKYGITDKYIPRILNRDYSAEKIEKRLNPVMELLEIIGDTVTISETEKENMLAAALLVNTTIRTWMTNDINDILEKNKDKVVIALDFNPANIPGDVKVFRETNISEKYLPNHGDLIIYDHHSPDYADEETTATRLADPGLIGKLLSEGKDVAIVRNHHDTDSLMSEVKLRGLLPGKLADKADVASMYGDYTIEDEESEGMRISHILARKLRNVGKKYSFRDLIMDGAKIAAGKGRYKKIYDEIKRDIKQDKKFIDDIIKTEYDEYGPDGPPVLLIRDKTNTEKGEALRRRLNQQVTYRYIKRKYKNVRILINVLHQYKDGNYQYSIALADKDNHPYDLQQLAERLNIKDQDDKEDWGGHKFAIGAKREGGSEMLPDELEKEIRKFLVGERKAEEIVEIFEKDEKFDLLEKTVNEIKERLNEKQQAEIDKAMNIVGRTIGRSKRKNEVSYHNPIHWNDSIKFLDTALTGMKEEEGIKSELGDVLHLAVIGALFQDAGLYIGKKGEKLTPGHENKSMDLLKKNAIDLELSPQDTDFILFGIEMTRMRYDTKYGKNYNENIQALKRIINALNSDIFDITKYSGLSRKIIEDNFESFIEGSNITNPGMLNDAIMTGMAMAYADLYGYSTNYLAGIIMMHEEFQRDENLDLLQATHLEHAAAYAGIYSNFCWHNRLSFIEEDFDIEKEYIPQEMIFKHK
ncbi:hypothetical protein ACFLUV_06930, partial [Elusimicrobiota bacterium]